MKHAILFVLTPLLLAFSLLTGCATVDVSTENGRTLCVAENTCWRLLWVLPIGSGDCEDPNDDFCVWFRNTVTLENSMKLLDYAREKKGARTIKDAQTFMTDDHYIFILRRTAMHSSCELVY